MFWDIFVEEVDMTQLELFPDLQEDRQELVFCWFFRHPKTGKIVRAKNGHPFCFPARR